MVALPFLLHHACKACLFEPGLVNREVRDSLFDYVEKSLLGFFEFFIFFFLVSLFAIFFKPQVAVFVVPAAHKFQILKSFASVLHRSESSSVIKDL